MKSAIKDVTFYQAQYNKELLYTNIEKIKNKVDNQRREIKNEIFIFGKKLDYISSDLLYRSQTKLKWDL